VHGCAPTSWCRAALQGPRSRLVKGQNQHQWLVGLVIVRWAVESLALPYVMMAVGRPTLGLGLVVRLGVTWYARSGACLTKSRSTPLPLPLN
jgi:hypothetical protein